VTRQGRLILVGTPIGNRDDASARLLAVLAHADVIAAEDTRRAVRLLRDLGVRTSAPIVSCYEAVEQARAEQFVARIADGQTVALITDAGMPAVSDPGFRVVAAVVAADQPVTVVPRPSAVLAALAVSGLPTDRFAFEGFPPRRAGDRDRWLARLAPEERTVVFFESPHRIVATLAAAAAVLGPERPAAVCRELTKVHEEVRRGPLAELAEWAAQGLRGEITVVLAGAPPQPQQADPRGWAEQVAAAESEGVPRKEAIAAVARRHGVPKREVFAAVVAGRDATGAPGR
jgi:16S rRNA (cytidine1402-2'-O)-methyltransferase